MKTSAGAVAGEIPCNQGKKVPPPTPEGHEGRLFPPEQSFKTVMSVTVLSVERKRKSH